MTPHERPAAGDEGQAGQPPGQPAPPPGPITWLRHALTQRQWHQCLCGDIRLVHLHTGWAPCTRCDCTGFVRRQQP